MMFKMSFIIIAKGDCRDNDDETFKQITHYYKIKTDSVSDYYICIKDNDKINTMWSI